MIISEKKQKINIVIISSISCVVLLLYITGIGCPIKRMTGIPCPGCGLTRAWVRCFHLDINGAFQNHPLFLIAPPLLFLGIHRGTSLLRKIPLKVQDGILIAGGVLFFAVYILRLSIAL